MSDIVLRNLHFWHSRAFERTNSPFSDIFGPGEDPDRRDSETLWHCRFEATTPPSARELVMYEQLGISYILVTFWHDKLLVTYCNAPQGLLHGTRAHHVRLHTNRLG